MHYADDVFMFMQISRFTYINMLGPLCIHERRRRAPGLFMNTTCDLHQHRMKWITEMFASSKSAYRVGVYSK